MRRQAERLAQSINLYRQKLAKSQVDETRSIKFTHRDQLRLEKAVIDHRILYREKIKPLEDELADIDRKVEARRQEAVAFVNRVAAKIEFPTGPQPDLLTAGKVAQTENEKAAAEAKAQDDLRIAIRADTISESAENLMTIAKDLFAASADFHAALARDLANKFQEEGEDLRPESFE